MKRRIVIAALLLTGICMQPGVAQQRAQSSQYMVNQFLLNPALAGTEEYADLRAGYRNQWLGLSGGPVTYYATAHMPIRMPTDSRLGRHKNQNGLKGWHGIGVNIYNDITGPTARTGFSFAYAYNLQLTQTLKMSLGAFAGFQQFRINGDEFVLHDEKDQVLNGKQTSIVPDLSLGSWFYTKESYLGIALGQLLQSKLDIASVAEGSKLNRHYFVTAGHRFHVSHDLDLVPSVMVKAVQPTPLSVDLNARLMYKEGQFWTGGSYRHRDSFTVFLGAAFMDGRIPVSYSYDLSVSRLIKYNSGSHEITVGYKIPKNHEVHCPQNFW